MNNDIGRVRSCLSIVVGQSQLVCHMLLVQLNVRILSNCVSATVEMIPSLKLSANFCWILP